MLVIPTTADETKDQEQLDHTNIKFPDNRLLIDLCGEFDKNLAEIEQQLALQIVRRGNELNLFGDEISRSSGKIVLEALYTRLKNGKPLDLKSERRPELKFVEFLFTGASYLSSYPHFVFETAEKVSQYWRRDPGTRYQRCSACSAAGTARS